MNLTRTCNLNLDLFGVENQNGILILISVIDNKPKLTKNQKDVYQIHKLAGYKVKLNKF